MVKILTGCTSTTTDTDLFTTKLFQPRAVLHIIPIIYQQASKYTCQIGKEKKHGLMQL